MNAKAKRVQIICPECDGFIVSVPKDELPAGDLVCPNCGATVGAPSQIDRLIDDVGDAIAGVLGTSKEEDRGGRD